MQSVLSQTVLLVSEGREKSHRVNAATISRITVVNKDLALPFQSPARRDEGMREFGRGCSIGRNHPGHHVSTSQLRQLVSVPRESQMVQKQQSSIVHSCAQSPTLNTITESYRARIYHFFLLV